jgi:hypothetical protein
MAYCFQAGRIEAKKRGKGVNVMCKTCGCTPVKKSSKKKAKKGKK